jgi:recombination protein RecR
MKPMLNATIDGQTTAHYIADQLAPSGVAVTSLAKGVPIGGSWTIWTTGRSGRR